MNCPKCGSKNIATERRPDGDSKCLDCGFSRPTRLFFKTDTGTCQTCTEELQRLRAYAEESRKVVEFYGDINDHWLYRAPAYSQIIDDDLSSDHKSLITSKPVGGKRAREFQQSETYKKVFGGV